MMVTLLPVLPNNDSLPDDDDHAMMMLGQQCQPLLRSQACPWQMRAVQRFAFTEPRK
jgi:hypothetical protein